jgi:hypothetical protein
VHAKKEEKKNPREVITRNPRRKIVRKKKENTSLKQKEKENNGGGEPYTNRCPLQPFFFCFSSSISVFFPSDTFHSSIPTPRSCNSS